MGIALLAVDFAIAKADLQDRAVLDAAGNLRASSRDSVELADLNALFAQYEHEYFALEDDAKAGLVDTEVYLSAFARAHAVSALVHALGADPLVTAAESVYEGAATVDDPNELYLAVDELV